MMLGALRINSSGLRFPICHQVAIYCPWREDALTMYQGMGYKRWVHDTALLVGKIGEKDEVVEIQACMSFNYEKLAGIELELVHYPSLNSHHHVRARSEDPKFRAFDHPFLSHMSTHVDDACGIAEEWSNGLDIPILHSFETYNHSNPAIAGKKRFREAIVGTREVLGYDIKFIERLEKGPWVYVPGQE